jgi:hypothetical protein
MLTKHLAEIRLDYLNLHARKRAHRLWPLWGTLQAVKIHVVRELDSLLGLEQMTLLLKYIVRTPIITTPDYVAKETVSN